MSLYIHHLPAAMPPIQVDARVEEQDTALLLDPHQILRDSGLPERVLISEMQRQKPWPAGSVLTEAGPPLRLLAVVYDVEAQPLSHWPWIVTALGHLARICQQRGYHSLSLPLLGYRFGGISAPALLKEIRSQFKINSDRPIHLWLRGPGRAGW